MVFMRSRVEEIMSLFFIFELIYFVYCLQICESLTSGPCHAIDITREVGVLSLSSLSLKFELNFNF